MVDVPGKRGLPERRERGRGREREGERERGGGIKRRVGKEGGRKEDKTQSVNPF